MRLLSKVALVSFGFCHGVDVSAPPLVRREAGKPEKSADMPARAARPSRRSSASAIEAHEVDEKQRAVSLDENARGKEEGIYGEAMDDGLSRFLVSSQALSEQNLRSLQIPIWDNMTNSIELGDTGVSGTGVSAPQGKVSDLEKQLANALEVAKAAEAAAKNASTMVAAQESQLRAANERIQVLEQKEADDEKDLRGALDAANLTKAELAGIILKEAHLGTKQENVDRVVKDIESKLVEFATAAVRAEKEADEAEDDAVKAKNTSDILKARQANMRYEVDDLSNSMEVLFKEQNITRKAEQLLLLKALGLGKSINQIDGSMKLVNGSISSIIRQALESLKLAKQAKEEADDALDDVESGGTSGFSGGYTKTASAQARSAKEAGSKSSSSSKPVVVSSSFDVNNAAAAAKQHAKAAWEAVKQMQVLNAMPRPIYEVASMTGDMIEIMKGPQGPPGKAGPDGLDGPRGKTGPPGKDAKPVDIENLTQMEVAGETTAEPTVADDDLVGAEEVAASNSTAALHTSPPPTRKGAGFGLYLVAFGANVVALFILYRWINAILNTGDLSARPWSRKH